MEGPLKALLARLKESRDGQLPSTQSFPPLDVEQIARALAVDSRGAENGRVSLPGAQDTQPDSVELDILAEIEKRYRKALEEYRTELATYETRIRDAAASSDFRVEIESAGQNALADFQAFAINNRNHLVVVQAEARGSHDEYQQFRARNALVRLPRLVSDPARALRWIVIAIVFLLESILNGMFFAEGSQAGLVGGVLQAAVLSLLNLGGAVLFATYGLPALLHRRVGVKLMGALMLIAYVAWWFALNLLIAHFRDAYVANAGNVQMDALWAHIVSHPFSLADAKSWMLCVMGMGLSLGTMISAAGLDDVYWGYGELGRRHARTAQRYAHEQEAGLIAIQQRRDDATEDMRQIIQELRRREYDRQLAVNGRARLHREFCVYVDHLAVSYERLVVRYREQNKCQRGSGEPPEFFKTRPARPAFLHVYELEQLPGSDDQVRVVAVDRMEHFIQAVNAEFASSVKQYDTTHAFAEPAADANAT
jgi:hypothetical protein